MIAAVKETIYVSDKRTYSTAISMGGNRVPTLALLLLLLHILLVKSKTPNSLKPLAAPSSNYGLFNRRQKIALTQTLSAP